MACQGIALYIIGREVQAKPPDGVLVKRVRISKHLTLSSVYLHTQQSCGTEVALEKSMESITQADIDTALAVLEAANDNVVFAEDTSETLETAHAHIQTFESYLQEHGELDNPLFQMGSIDKGDIDAENNPFDNLIQRLREGQDVESVFWLMDDAYDRLDETVAGQMRMEPPELDTWCVVNDEFVGVVTEVDGYEVTLQPLSREEPETVEVEDAHPYTHREAAIDALQEDKEVLS